MKKFSKKTADTAQQLPIVTASLAGFFVHRSLDSLNFQRTWRWHYREPYFNYEFTSVLPVVKLKRALMTKSFPRTLSICEPSRPPLRPSFPHMSTKEHDIKRERSMMTVRKNNKLNKIEKEKSRPWELIQRKKSATSRSDMKVLLSAFLCVRKCENSTVAYKRFNIFPLSTETTFRSVHKKKRRKRIS